MSRFWKVANIAIALILGSLMLFGQAETGQLIGTVTDSSGAVIPNAKVTVKSVGSGAVRTAQTSQSGNYTVTNLRPDTYEVTVEGSGFQNATSRVVVNVGSRVEYSPKLAVGAASQTVEVTADVGTAVVNTETQTLSQVVDSREMQQLPTLTRNAYDLVGTAGNVSDSEQQGANGNSARGAGFNINGQRSANTDILLDGGENVDLFTATVGQNVPLDSVQELKVVTSAFTAEYGRAGGGVVNVATKSGTNNFHGTAYEFNRLSALAANTYEHDAQRALAFQNGTCVQGQPCDIGKKDRFTRNQFGYSFGGPVVKNKLFFFSSTEWTRVRSATTQLATVVDPAFLTLPQVNSRTKDFFNAFGKLKSDAIVVQKLGWGATGTGTERSTLLPANSPFLQVVQFNLAADAGGGSPQNTWSSVNRIDFNWTDKTTLYGRYAVQKNNYFAGVTTFSPYAGYDTGENIFNNNVMFNVTHIFTPNLVSQSKVVYNRLNDNQPLGPNPIGPTLYESNLGVPTIASGLLLFPGYSPNTPGNSIPFGGPQNLYEFYQDLAWTKGRHQFRFGGNYIHTRDNRTFGAYEGAVASLDQTNDLGNAFNNLVNGTLDQFQGAIYPQGKFPCVRDANTGDPIVTPQCTLDLPVGPPSFTRHNRYHDGAWYAQDSWKVSNRLTLNLGVRWEYYGVQHNDNPALDSNFYLGPGNNIHEQIRNGSVQLATQRGGLWKPNKKNYAPRVGFAWDVFGNGRTSLRGGYGIGYERNFGNVTFNVIQNPPNYAVVSVNPGDVGGTLFLPTDNAGPLAGTGIQVPLPPSSLRAVNPNINSSYTQSWSLATDNQFAKNMVLSLEYSGAKGTHLYDIGNINVNGTGELYLGSGGRQNLQYSNINWRGSNGFSSYHGLNVRVAGNNLRGGLNFTANYTWSHSIDNLSNTFSEGSNGTFQLGYTDPFNPARDKGNSEYDVRHRVVISGIWNMPWGSNANGGMLSKIFGGWGIAPIFTARTGTPFSIYDCTNGSYNCPRYAPGVNVPTQGGPGPIADPTVANEFTYITLPTDAGGKIAGLGTAIDLPQCTGLFGQGCSLPYKDIGRNAYRSPGNWNFNFALMKTIPVTEGTKLEFRGELYNAFNHHNYYVLTNNADVYGLDLLGTNTIDVKKGGYGDYRDERRNIQLGLKLIF